MPGVQELLVIAVVALLVFGPERLPEIARTAAKAMVRFRSETQRGLEELKRAAEIEDLERELAEMKRDLKSAGDQVRAETRQVTRSVPRAQPLAPLPRQRPQHQPPPVDLQAT